MTIAAFFFLSQTEIYYQYCKHAAETGDYLIEENVELYKKICDDHYKDYSNHILMNHSINIFYGFMEMTSVKLLSLNSKIYMKKKISRERASLEFNLKVHKFTHTALYILVIYVFVIIMPNLFFDFVVYVLNKMLIVLFFAFALEGIVNYLFNFNIDSLMMLKEASHYINFDYFNNIFKILGRLFGMVYENKDKLDILEGNPQAM